MSMFSPFFLLWTVCNVAINKTLSSSAALVTVINSLLIIWYYVFFLRNIKKHIPIEPIELKSFKPSDGKIFDFVLQMMPIIGSIVNNYVVGLSNNYIGLLIYVVMVGYLTISNHNFVSLLLLVCRPKLYEIDIEGGGHGYLLATKKELKNHTEIKTAKHIFPYFYID